MVGVNNIFVVTNLKSSTSDGADVTVANIKALDYIQLNNLNFEFYLNDKEIILPNTVKLLLTSVNICNGYEKSLLKLLSNRTVFRIVSSMGERN